MEKRNEEANLGANELNEEFNEELKKLLETMSGLNIEHKRTLHDCYAEYFDQKVEEFQNAEKQIGLLLQLFVSKSNDLTDLTQAECVIQKREEFLPNITESFHCIKNEGFGIVQSYNMNNDTAKTQMEPKSADNFCDFILKDLNNCDNEIEMIGYGAVAPRHFQNNNDSPLKLKSEIDVYPCTNDAASPDQLSPLYLNSKIPPRLRFKRHFSLMTNPAAPSTGGGEAYPTDAEIKRKREMDINNIAQ